MRIREGEGFEALVVGEAGGRGCGDGKGLRGRGGRYCVRGQQCC